jgi:hypothetical protein
MQPALYLAINFVTLHFIAHCRKGFIKLFVILLSVYSLLGENNNAQVCDFPTGRDRGKGRTHKFIY